MEPGTVLDSYRFDALVSSDALSSTWRVTHKLFDREQVAILVEAAGPRADFLTAARLQAQVRHPALVGVAEVWDRADAAGIVLEATTGKSLPEWIQALNAPLSQEAFLDLAVPLLEGTAYAHSWKLCHGFLEPSRVQVRAGFVGRAEPVILGFGTDAVLERARGRAGVQDPAQDLRALVRILQALADAADPATRRKVAPCLKRATEGGFPDVQALARAVSDLRYASFQGSGEGDGLDGAESLVPALPEPPPPPRPSPPAPQAASDDIILESLFEEEKATEETFSVATPTPPPFQEEHLAAEPFYARVERQARMERAVPLPVPPLQEVQKLQQRATFALILSLVGLMGCCFPASIGGLVLANNARKALTEAGAPPDSARLANAASVLSWIGLVGTVMFWLVSLFGGS